MLKIWHFNLNKNDLTFPDIENISKEKSEYFNSINIDTKNVNKKLHFNYFIYS